MIKIRCVLVFVVPHFPIPNFIRWQNSVFIIRIPHFITTHSRLSADVVIDKMASTDDSLYPIAVLIDELRNEDVQV